MVFFNYSTMQMAAKIVYYGPGLCGKTTNLQYIYEHTSSDSRGEMVSLETETDRTLFFDLLPIDVGTIGGFNTRIQLYTVPGQVFYNTTRKLVLKGVDGVVFVADSQRPMLQANIESFKNLEENLAEIGLSSQEVPLVLQYNKRDLGEICSVQELNEALNPHGWPNFEASALTGQGVKETLKGISKLTLIALRKRLSKDSAQSQQGARPGTGPISPPPPTAAPAPAAPALAVAPPVATAPPVAAPPAAASPVAPSPAVPTPPVVPAPTAPLPVAGSNSAVVPPSEPGAPQTPAFSATPPTTPDPLAASPPPVAPPPAAHTPPSHLQPPAPISQAPAATPAPPPTQVPEAPQQASSTGTRKQVDVLAELEKIRQQALGSRPTPPPRTAATGQPPPAKTSPNGQGEIAREIQLNVARGDFVRTRRFAVRLQVEDEEHRIVNAVQDTVEVADAASLNKILLRLNVTLNPED